MDLSAINTVSAANEGAVLELRGPDGAALLQDDGTTPITITLLGDDSDAMVALAHKQANRFLRSQGRAPVTAEGAMSNMIERLATATIAWDGFTVDGETWPCDADHAKKLYRDFPWIRDQVKAFTEDRANFSKASPKS